MIHTASLSFAWENVYNYDRDFRLHMEKFPERSWAIILQQSWSIRLKDKHSNSGGVDMRRRKDICYRYNKGKCSYGAKCKFEHKCGICNKFGHGAHNCRRGQDRSYKSEDRSGEQWKKKDEFTVGGKKLNNLN